MTTRLGGRRAAFASGIALAALGIVLVVHPTDSGGTSPSGSSEVLAAAASELKSEYAITAEPVSSALVTVPPVDAVKIAQSTVGFTSDSPAGAPVLVEFTDENYGEDPDGDGKGLEPYFVKHPAWLVTFENVSVPILGPAGYTGPCTYEATVLVFIDATTGGLIEAVTL